MKSRQLKLLVILLPVVILAGCVATGTEPGSVGWGHMFGYGMYGGYLMWLVLIIAIAAVVYAVLRTGSSNRSSSGNNEENSLELLKRRYARGEISEEEYDRMKKKLMDD